MLSKSVFIKTKGRSYLIAKNLTFAAKFQTEVIFFFFLKAKNYFQELSLIHA